MKEIFAVIFPSMMIMWIFFIAQNAMADIHEEKNRKTLVRLLATTATINQILISKMLRCFLLCLISESTLIIASWLVFGMSWGNPVTLFLVLCSANLAITGLLALVYALSKSKQRADMICVIVILFSSFAGGGMIPFDQLPGFIQSMGSMTVNRWGAVAIQAVIEAQPFLNALKPTLLLFVVGGLCTLSGIMILKKQIEAGEIT